MHAESIEWSWNATGLSALADVSDTYADDSPGRIILAFDGNTTEFGFRDRLFFEQVRAFTGIDLPYATMIYVWDPRLPVGSVVAIPQTSRIRYVVVESGPSNQGKWTSYRRDIAEDYRLAFRADASGLVAVGLMSDTDDLATRTETLYGDLRPSWSNASVLPPVASLPESSPVADDDR